MKQNDYDLENQSLYSSSALFYIGKLVFKVLRAAFMLLMVFIILYPVLYMISMAFRTTADVYDLTVVWIPKNFSVQSFSLLYREFGIVEPLFNTFWISLLSSVAQVFVVSFTAYGFARFRFFGRNILFMLLVFSIVVPPQMISMPTYLMFSKFDLFGIITAITGSTISLLGKPLVFPFLALIGQGIRSSLFILILRQYYKGFPSAIEEAALIDGCGYFRCYHSIMLPSARTQLFIVFLFSVVWYWNDYYFASIYLGGASTFSVKLSNIRPMLELALNHQSSNSYQIAIYEQAGCLVLIVPLMVMFIFTQKYFVYGLERTGLVG